MDTAVQQAVTLAGRLDILVNNAGIILRENALEYREADWDATIQIDLKAVFFLSQAAARVMEQQGGGKIINIASLLSFQGGIRVPAYSAAKHGVVGLTRALANEWAAKNINVNAIVPGYIDTEATVALREDTARNAAIVARIPVGHWGTPADLQGAAVFLASDAAKYVHGATLDVDGGWMAR
jgi:2-deoxy-D-gluconate 3-dehydrogenase